MAECVDTSQFTEAEINVAHILVCMSKSMFWNDYEGKYVQNQQQPVQQKPANRPIRGDSRRKSFKSISSISKLKQNKENRSPIARRRRTTSQITQPSLITTPQEMTLLSPNSDVPQKRTVISCYLRLKEDPESGMALKLVPASTSGSCSGSNQ